jgi:predicted HD phosphohydrolase
MNETSQDGTALDAVVALLRKAGSQEEPNEDISGLTILHHGLQCAANLLGTNPDDPELHVAGLLHDVGHVLAPGREDIHGAVGAAFVRPVFGDRIASIIEGHVPAKRYLVTVDESYRERLSEGSIRTLAMQGSDMTADELAAFRSAPHSDDAVQLRRADEEAKDPAASVPPLDTWLSTLNLVAR